MGKPKTDAELIVELVEAAEKMMAVLQAVSRAAHAGLTSHTRVDEDYCNHYSVVSQMRLIAELTTEFMK